MSFSKNFSVNAENHTQDDGFYEFVSGSRKLEQQAAYHTSTGLSMTVELNLNVTLSPVEMCKRRTKPKSAEITMSLEQNKWQLIRTGGNNLFIRN